MRVVSSNQLSRGIKARARHVIGWGAGNYYRELVEADERTLIEFFIDDDQGKWGGALDGIPIFPPDKLLEMSPEETQIIVFSGYFYDDITPRIIERGHHHFLPGHLWVQFQLERLENELANALQTDTSGQDLAALYHERARLSRRLSRTGMEIVALEKALKLDPSPLAWRYDLAAALLKICRYADAATLLKKTISGDPNPCADHFYQLGYSLDAIGKYAEAEAAYAKAVTRHPAPLTRVLGSGFFHYQAKRLPEARQAFQNKLETNPDCWPLLFRLGRTEEHCFNWKHAARAYEQVVAIIPNLANGHYRLGFSLERQGKLTEAISAYRKAVTLAPRRTSWFYRLGVLLRQSGEYEEACKLFEHSHPRPGQYLAVHEQETTLQAAREAVARRDYETAASTFERLRPIARPSLVPIRRKVDYTVLYNEFRETLPLLDKTILYESFFGGSISGNPYGLFQHIAARDDFADWRHVWVVKETTDIPAHMKHDDRIKCVVHLSPEYFRYLATAPYLINDVTFPHCFSRRTGQHYLNTWHGTPLKTLGLDIAGNLFDHRNVARNFLHATHICSPNPHTTRVLTERFHVANTYTSKLAETGYPRIDLTLRLPEERKQAIRDRLDIHANEFVVLYAPTWRGTPGKEQTDIERLQHDLAQLAALPCKLLFRGHQFIERHLYSSCSSCSVPPPDIDTNELLALADILVTDYSSVFFDFIPTGRPIVFYAHDEEAYRRTRGLYFALSEMPGTSCKTSTELVDVLRDLINCSAPAHPLQQTALETFCPHEDGFAAQRVADWFLLDKPAHEIASANRSSPSILFNAGPFIPSGVTSSALNLLDSLAHEPVRTIVAVNPGFISPYPERVEKFREIPQHTEVLANVGRMNLSPEENWVVDTLNHRYQLPSEQTWKICRHGYEREFRRNFGATSFDVLCDYTGYSQYWAALFAFAPKSNKRRIVYQHNDMAAESITRFPSLQGVFELYKHFDALISVSESVCQNNRIAFEKPYDVPPAHFLFCNNPISPERVRRQAAEPLPKAMQQALEATHHPARKTCIFVTVGRLSPEKGHEKLFRAFARLHADHPHTTLWVVGDGPLKLDLKRVISDLNLQHAILLCGHYPNPAPLVQAADCFVLSSEYEGQGLVLLEALMQGKPVIATDVVGVRSVLEKGHGLLVENSESGLVQGMVTFLENRLESKPFDENQYRKDALDRFMRCICTFPA